MKYLLDTHAAIWALDDKNKLSDAARRVIDDVSLLLFVSIVSAWEIAIKISIGRLKFNGGSEAFLKKMKTNGVELLPLNGSQIKYIESLPMFHRDPFDRLIVAAAVVNNMTIVTADENICKYAPVVW